ncbi:thermonuclease family protein [bacterium]|nr:thermonuclease family protein [bacterium]
MLSILLCCCLCSPETISGKVISITDGDTIKILVQKQQITIRLNAIDAPEIGQPFGQKSKQALSSLIGEKIVSVDVVDRDRYGRSVGNVRIGERLINEEMVRDGWAWHFKKYSKSKMLDDLEADAREAKRGLWSDSQAPEAPWDYRSRMARERGEERPEPVDGIVHVTRDGNRYHAEGCRHLKGSVEEITVAEAKRRGLSPCKVCGGHSDKP